MRERDNSYKQGVGNSLQGKAGKLGGVTDTPYYS